MHVKGSDSLLPYTHENLAPPGGVREAAPPNPGPTPRHAPAEMAAAPCVTDARVPVPCVTGARVWPLA